MHESNRGERSVPLQTSDNWAEPRFGAGNFGVAPLICFKERRSRIATGLAGKIWPFARPICQFGCEKTFNYPRIGNSAKRVNCRVARPRVLPRRGIGRRTDLFTLPFSRRVV